MLPLATVTLAVQKMVNFVTDMPIMPPTGMALDLGYQLTILYVEFRT